MIVLRQIEWECLKISKNKLWFSEADLRDSWMSCVGRFTEESQ